MPIDSVQRSIHIRRRKNNIVFQNIDRLAALSLQAKTHQDILDGLHPWNAPIKLRFDNQLPVLLGLMGLACCALIFFQADSIWLQCGFFAGLMMLFWAWISYEHDKPIKQVIEQLETSVIEQKYQLKYFGQPQHIDLPLQPALLMAKLKQMFPLFDQGDYANEIPLYASSIWEDDNGQKHSVLLFQYRYVNEIKMRDKDGKETQVKLVEKFQWGVFVFEVDLYGLALSSTGRNFYYPYSFPWQTSDILLNQKIKIFGSNQIDMVKQLSPSMVLRFADFFDKQHGNLLFHPEKNCLCFLGMKDLFQIQSKKNKIEDISTLRGHLRTFKLAHLERLKTDLLQFLK
jgi:hypothetical protein